MYSTDDVESSSFASSFRGPGRRDQAVHVVVVSTVDDQITATSQTRLLKCGEGRRSGGTRLSASAARVPGWFGLAVYLQMA